MNAVLILAIATWCNGLSAGGLTAPEDIEAVNQQTTDCKVKALKCVQTLVSDKRKPCGVDDALAACLVKK